MFRLKISKPSFLINIIFVASAALMFFLMALTYKHMQRLLESNRWLNHSLEVSLKIEKLFTDIKDIESERRNFILSRDSVSKNRIRSKIKGIPQAVKKIRHLVSDNRMQIEYLINLEQLISQKIVIVNETIDDNEEDLNDRQTMQNSLAKGRKVMDEITAVVNEMIAEENRLLNKRKDDLYFTEQTTPVYIYILGIFTLGMLGFAFIKMNSDVRRHKQMNDDLLLALNVANLAEIVGEYGIWIYNPKTKSYTFSDNYYRLHGLQLNEYPDNFWDLVASEDREDFIKVVDTYKAGHNISPFTFRYTKPNGEERIFQIAGKNLIANDHPVFLGITLDLTEEAVNRQKLEQATQEISYYNESSREMEKVAGLGFLRWSKENNEMLFSENIPKIFGYGIQKIDQLEELFKNVHPEDLQHIRHAINDIKVSHLQITNLIFRIFRYSDGQLRYLNLNSKKIEENNRNYWLIIAQDITEQTLSKKEIEQQNRKLENNNKELQSFNYIASHDLQEPLRKIETFISRLEDREAANFSETGQQYFSRIKAASKRMRTLITDLLQLSRTSRTNLVFENSNLNNLLENAIEEHQQAIDDKKAEIIWERLPDLKVIPFQIQQLFGNLISNSLKYSREDTLPKITILSKLVVANKEKILDNHSGNQFYKIVFEDNGIGFSPEYNHKIFDLFTRLHGKTEFEGTGIGLAICKKIAENHHGYLFANGTPDRGATFTIYLPSRA